MSASSTGSGFDSVLTDVLADLANRGLDLDPASRARLAALDGRELQIVLELPPPLHERVFTLAVRARRVRLFPRDAEHPHAVVRGSPRDLAAWLFAGEPTAASRLVIEGDSTLLTELRAAIQAFRPDLESPLSRLIGDEFAQAALGTVELALATVRSALEGAGHAMRDGAARAFVNRAQTDRFLDELDDLRLRVDRLDARVRAEEQSRIPP